MTAIVADEVKKHLDNAALMDDEVFVSAIKSRKMAWGISIASMSIAVVALIILSMVFPLKTLVPYVIKVDSSTGIIETVRPLEESPIPQDEALTKFFINKFMVCREQYDRNTAEDCYSNIQMLADSFVFREYHEYFGTHNDASPLHVYGSKAVVEIKIKTVAFLGDELASIRYTKTIKWKDDRRKKSHWIATLGFKYINEPATQEQRFINPLGFKVTSYRNDPEVIE